MLLADYNCDGKKDIFTNTTFGLKVYKNTTDGQLTFELQEDPLLTEIGGSMVNLQVGSSDLPALSDIDGDGDLDILGFFYWKTSVHQVVDLVARILPWRYSPIMELNWQQSMGIRNLWWKYITIWANWF